MKTTTAFMSRSKIYSSIAKGDAVAVQTRLLASATRKAALGRLGVDVESAVKVNSMSGNASAVVKQTSSPVVFDSDWVNNIKHSLKNDNDLRGLKDVYETDGELHVIFDKNVDLRKVINPMWRGIQAWNFTQLVFDRIDESNNALIYLQRAGDTRNHAHPNDKESGSSEATPIESELPATEELIGKGHTPIESSAGAKAKTKKETSLWLAGELTESKISPRGIWLKDVTIDSTGGYVRIEADIKQINSKAVDLTAVVMIEFGSPMNDDGEFTADVITTVGSQKDTRHVDKSKCGSIATVIKDMLADLAKAEQKAIESA